MKKTNAEIFLDFNYKELKDLGKHFLTISSASVVFILTFFEKFIPIADNGESLDKKAKIGVALLLISVITAGTGLFTNYIAGSGATNSMIWKIGKNYKRFTCFTYLLYITAGLSLILAYIILLLFVGNK